jgi:hypothetical protein
LFLDKYKENSPAFLRVSAFKEYFSKIGKNIYRVNDRSDAFRFLFTGDKSNLVFISMPAFRRLWLFFIPGVRVVLDIRDGWSIAQESGYGGNVRKKPIKAKVTRVIERLIIRNSYVVITCTNGLQEYLSKVSGQNVILIPNGISDSDYAVAQRVKQNKNYKENENTGEAVFCCAGKFSEYGVDKVKVLCEVIANRYQERYIKIILIGSSVESNQWLNDYFSKLTNGRGVVEILPRMGREELYSTMAKSDFGITILRDPSYDFGTKIYDYIALGLPVVNYFEEPNNFTRYFDACLDKPFDSTAEMPEIRRSKLIEKELNKVRF